MNGRGLAASYRILIRAHAQPPSRRQAFVIAEAEQRVNALKPPPAPLPRHKRTGAFVWTR